MNKTSNNPCSLDIGQAELIEKLTVEVAQLRMNLKICMVISAGAIILAVLI